MDAPEPPTEPAAGERTGPSTAFVVGLGCVLLGIALVGIVLVRANVGGSDDGASTSVTVEVTAADQATGSTAPLGSSGLGEGVAQEVNGRTPLRGFGEAWVTITAPDGSTCDACLLAATEADQRERGLMEVTDTDLGGYDGMLFEYPAPQPGAFWMRNTPMPLSIAYFDAAGRVVSTADMTPCGDSSNCPTYPADGEFQFAIEVPLGGLGDLGIEPGSTLRVRTRTCPLATSGG